jgi:hypothetical protein
MPLAWNRFGQTLAELSQATSSMTELNPQEKYDLITRNLQVHLELTFECTCPLR